MTVRGVDEVLRNLNKAGGLIEEAAQSAGEAVGQEVRTNAIKLIQRRSPGHQVFRYTGAGNRYMHMASNAGEAPNTDTGRLANSITTWPDGRNTRVGTDVIYGRHLEFGTKNMEARPFMVPAKESAEKNKAKHLQSAIERGLVRL